MAKAGRGRVGRPGHGRITSADVVPIPRTATKRVNRRAVPCPDCGAEVDEPCTSSVGTILRASHASRVRMATRAQNEGRVAAPGPPRAKRVDTGERTRVADGPLRWTRDGGSQYVAELGPYGLAVERKATGWEGQVFHLARVIHRGWAPSAPEAKVLAEEAARKLL